MPVIVTLPVPLFTGKSAWQAVQFASPGAFVCDGEGPLADAATFILSDEAFVSPKTAIKLTAKIAESLAALFQGDLLVIGWCSREKDLVINLTISRCRK